MSKNTKLLHCILGSIILSLISMPVFYDAVHYIPVVGFYLSQSLYFISAIGVISTIYFAIVLIKENLSFKQTILIYCYIKRVGRPTLFSFSHHKAYKHNIHQQKLCTYFHFLDIQQNTYYTNYYYTNSYNSHQNLYIEQYIFS